MTIRIDSNALSDALAASTGPVKKNGSGSDFGSLLKHAEAGQSDAAADLEKYMRMSPAERIASAMRKQLGISDEAYAAMSPEEKQAVDAKVADMIKQKMQEQIAKQQGGGDPMSGISL